ncbi:MAG: ABC transporter ATP-binding protein [Bacteroidetes bacterium]|nr:ABC transporter ATP-binding protein [Bacteroidota bacterium]
MKNNSKSKYEFWEYFKYYFSILRGQFIISIILSTGVSLFDGIGMAMFMPLLQSVSDDGNSVVSSSNSLGKLHYFTDALAMIGLKLNLITILFILSFLFITKGFLKFLQMYHQVKMRQHFMKTVQLNLTNSIHNLSYEGFLTFDAGKIQNSLNTEVALMRNGIMHYLNSFQSIIMLLIYMLLAFTTNWQFALLVSVGAIISNFVFKKIFSLTKQASSSLSRKGDQFNSYILQAVHYFKYLKSTNYFSFYSKKLKKTIDETETLNKKIGLYQSITSSVREPVLIIIVSLVILIQVKLIGTGLNTIILSLLLFYRALVFLLSLQASWQSYLQNIGSFKSINATLDKMDLHQEKNPGNLSFEFSDNIKLNKVSLQYGSKVIINDISLDIPKNKTVAFVGESGSGKTTLANLVSSLLTPTAGEIVIDNKSMASFDIESYRNKIGYISQEPVIFNDTIFNNITFWAEPTTETIEHFNKIIALTHLTDFINNLPEKENTQLGDHGILISGGQRQRISIARELFKSVEILILDEATSSLDSETEAIIQKNIDSLHGNFTIIIIAHRLSTIKNSDIIYLIEKGKLKDYGKFDDLVERSQRFKHMVELQEF